MAMNLTKRLSVLAATVLILVLCIPGIALATPVHLLGNYSFFPHSVEVKSDSAEFSEINLTPQQRQQLQAVRQRRNREINAVLDDKQRQQLAETLRAGSNINQALATINLREDQRDLVTAIMEITNLKIKAIIARSPINVGEK